MQTRAKGQILKRSLDSKQNYKKTCMKKNNYVVKDKISELLNFIDQEKMFFKNKYQKQRLKGKGKFHDVEKDVLKYQVKIYKNIFEKIADFIDCQGQDCQGQDDKRFQNKNNQIKKQHENKLSHLIKLNSELQIKNKALQNNLNAIEQKNAKLQVQMKKLKLDLHQKNSKKYQKQKQAVFVLEEQHNQLQIRCQKISKQLQIYKRKADQFDKLGGKSTYQKNKQKIKELNQTIQNHNDEKQKLKDKIKELSNKCQILTTINIQTQDKLAELMTQKVSNLKFQRSRAKSTFSTAYETSAHLQKQNIQHISNLNSIQNQRKTEKLKNVLNPNLQIMALKQQNNKYRKQVEFLQIKNKELIKKYNDKEVFFSKLVQYS